MIPPGRILLVNAKGDLGDLRAHLLAATYVVATPMSGKIALCQLGAEAFDLVLLDFESLDLDWRDFLTRARELWLGPIIALSAHSEQNEKVEALDLGASDHLAKPFDMTELLARVRAALRLIDMARAAVIRNAAQERLTLHISSRSAVVDGRVVRLSTRECAVLHVLIEAAGGHVNFEEIIEKVWNRRIAADAQRVRVLIWQLRRKIEPDPARPCFIISEPGLGYRLNPAGIGAAKTPEHSH